jgi:hypothetical protein
MVDEAGHITPVEAEKIAEAAARRVVHEFFHYLDINPNDKDDMKRFREDLTYLSDQRAGTERLKVTIRKSALYVFGTTLAAGAYWLWDVLKVGLMVKTGGG